MEKISNKISSNFGVSPPHFSAMVFESLMGSAWAVIWLGRGKWAKRPTQLGGFHHVSPRSLGRWMIPFDEHITYGVVQPPPRQFGTLQVSSCTVSLQILCIVCSDVMSLFSPVFSSLFFFLGRSSTCKGAVCLGVWSCYRETLERALGLCLQPGSLPVRCRFGWGIFCIVHFYT